MTMTTMTRWTQLCLAAVAALALGACDTTPRDETGAVGTAGETTLEAERGFVEDFAKSNTTEVELGRLAEQRAANPAVREFGAMIVRDHTKAGEALRQIASRHGLVLEAEYTQPDAREKERFSNLSGADFDREFMETMVDKHERSAETLENKAERGGQADLKRWASETLPVVRQHLERAKQIQQQIRG
jgi:putative membrane protein